MNKLGLVIATAMTVLASSIIGNKLQAQMPPGFTNGGGSYTNDFPYTNYYSPPPYVPGLKLAIPPAIGTNLSINLLEADPAGTYDIYTASNLVSSAWNDVASGTNGQTNFTLPFAFPDMEFFRAARTDTPVVNTAGMTAFFPNTVVSNRLTGAIVYGGPAAAMAVLVNDTNLADALWLPSSAVPYVLLGTNDGTYSVTFGFIGSDGQTNWTSANVTLDTTPPPLFITGPTNSAVTQPVIQLTGFSPEALSSLSYDISNAAGLVTNQQVLVLDQFYDTNLLKFTTNNFQAFDVPLTNGVNLITIHANDLAGNVTTLTTNLVLNYAGKTNSPVVLVNWPLAGVPVCGSNFTCNGSVSDPTANITIQLVDTNGDTNIVDATVGRDGNFWAEYLPLSGGTNFLNITTTDAAGNSATTNLAVVQGDTGLAIDSVSAGQTMVTGEIDPSISSGYTIWVNGNQATNNGDGTWTAQIAPFGVGGGVVEAMAISNSDNGGSGSGGGSDSAGNPKSVQAQGTQLAVDAPTGIYTSYYQYHLHKAYPASSASEDFFVKWQNGVGGYETDETWNWSGGYPHTYKHYDWPATAWPIRLPGYGTEIYNTDGSWNTNSFYAINPPLRMEYAHNLTEKHNPIGFDYSTVGETIQMDEQAELKLATGGKPGSTTRNLFVISAASYFNAEVNEFLTGTSVPRQQVAIGSLGNLGADGNLYVVLPDNATNIDVTPRVNGLDWYGFNLTAQKYPTTVTASTNGTAVDLSTNTPEFCVGQQVTFTLEGLPMGSISNMVGKWILPQKYVNYKLQYVIGVTSPNYDSDDGCLQNTNQTSCWFINGNGGHVSVGLNLQFNNGQYAGVAGNGNITVFRPQANLDGNSIVIGQVGVMATGQTLPASKIDSGGCLFDATITSKDFPGKANWVQLIDRQMTCDGFGSLFYLNNNTGGYLLDNDPFYNTVGGAVGTAATNSPVAIDSPNTIPYGTAGAGDDPNIGILSASFVSPADSFKTYLVFNPDPALAGNIWVTLGRVDWGWSGYAAFDIPTAKWLLITGSTNSPAYTNTDEFPVWPSIYHNSK
jgi:hypothetical protein